MYKKEAVEFLYLQPAGIKNAYDAGLAKVKEFKLKGAFGYDAPKEGKPITLGKYFARGTPWTIIIDHTGIVRFSRYTQQNGGKIRATLNHALRALQKAQKKG